MKIKFSLLYLFHINSAKKVFLQKQIPIYGFHKRPKKIPLLSPAMDELLENPIYH